MCVIEKVIFYIVNQLQIKTLDMSKFFLFLLIYFSFIGFNGLSCLLDEWQWTGACITLHEILGLQGKENKSVSCNNEWMQKIVAWNTKNIQWKLISQGKVTPVVSRMPHSLYGPVQPVQRKQKNP